jgi:hypothetical protein
MELATFAIPSFRKTGIQKRLEKLARKATKYGNSDIQFTFGKETVREVQTEYGPRLYEFIDITVTGDAPQIAGWQLLARVEIMDGDENLVHSVPGSTVQIKPDYRTHDGHCDHCKTVRRRNDVYVLTDGTEQIAVGRTCLRDFLGIDDPKSIVNRAQFFEELRSFSEEDFGGYSNSGYFDLHEFLEISAAYIRRNGYVSKAKQQETGYSTTGESASYAIRRVPGYEIKTTEDDKEWATKTIKFFRSTSSFGADYMDNIRVLMKQDLVKTNHVNLIASSVFATQRALAPKAEFAESSFVGEIKQRIRGLDLMLEKIIFLGHGSFGPSYLHLLKDSAGNVFSWITGNKLELAQGTRIKMDATVKEHKLYNGVKQTVLTRAKQLEEV